LAVQKLIQSLTEKSVFIKWPNDIFIERKKVAGILIQNTIASYEIKSTVLGIGININQTIFDPSIQNVTSLALSANKQFDLKELYPLLFKEIEYLYLKLKNEGAEELINEYNDCLFAKHQKTKFKSNNHEFYGFPRQIDKNGNLVVQLENQETKSFQHHELAWIL